MKTVLNYRLIVKDEHQQLNDEVESCLRKGWELYKKPIINRVQGSVYTRYAQAVVLYKKDETSH